jgi:hypothetical protein
LTHSGVSTANISAVLTPEAYVEQFDDMHNL